MKIISSRDSTPHMKGSLRWDCYCYILCINNFCLDWNETRNERDAMEMDMMQVGKNSKQEYKNCLHPKYQNHRTTTSSVHPCNASYNITYYNFLYLIFI